MMLSLPMVGSDRPEARLKILMEELTVAKKKAAKKAPAKKVGQEGRQEDDQEEGRQEGCCCK